MLTVDEKESIRQEYFGQGRPSMREIARERGHSWRTVKKAILEPSPSVYRPKKPRECPVVGPFAALIDEMLATDRSRPKKHRHTARRIWKRLMEEQGFQGEESSVCRYVRRWKREHEVGVADIEARSLEPPPPSPPAPGVHCRECRLPAAQPAMLSWVLGVGGGLQNAHYRTLPHPEVRECPLHSPPKKTVRRFGPPSSRFHRDSTRSPLKCSRKLLCSRYRERSFFREHRACLHIRDRA